MIKLPIIILVGIVAVAFLARAFVPQPKSSVNQKAATGVVVQARDSQGSFFGIQEDFRWAQPFAHRSLRPMNLGDEFKAGDRVGFTYVVTDVTGIGRWTTYIRVETIERLR